MVPMMFVRFDSNLNVMIPPVHWSLEDLLQVVKCFWTRRAVVFFLQATKFWFACSMTPCPLPVSMVCFGLVY